MRMRMIMFCRRSGTYRFFTDDRPEAMGCIEMMRRVLDEFDHRVLCGRGAGRPIGRPFLLRQEAAADWATLRLSLRSGLDKKLLSTHPPSWATNSARGQRMCAPQHPRQILLIFLSTLEF